MTFRDIDINVSKETKSMLKEVEKFSMEVMRPAGIELDRLSDPADAIKKESVLWDVFKGFREMDLHLLQIPNRFGGMADDLDPMAGILITEQLGYADAGLCISMGVSSMPFNAAAQFPMPDMQQLARDFCADKSGEMVGCWAITEPNHGTDWSLGGDKPKCGPSVTAVLKGDEYIVNGEKSEWVSNGTIATHAVLHVSLYPERGMDGQGLAIIPLDLPGISRGKALDKMGQRSLNQGSIIFQDAQIPKKYMVIPNPDFLKATAGQGLANVNGGMAVVFAGLAKAAYDEAYRYARKRIQGGIPIFGHKNIKLKLMKMFMQVEAARANARRMAMFNQQNPMNPSVIHAVAAKILSTETATRVASDAMQIFGGNGLAKEYPIEKIFRDARASMIEDGVNDALAIKAAEFM
ncbi:MAG: acyl-CoA/acyl-ACP dehydrogenase [Desulfobacteraceae bacterium]|jgi:alkylation response protein AidB-like acyl-CoA dehydrogenase|nr:acyl-CoA/acyl-ACP dehydrogenase [Desulfobacteraceae bacterium]